RHAGLGAGASSKRKWTAEWQQGLDQTAWPIVLFSRHVRSVTMGNRPPAWYIKSTYRRSRAPLLARVPRRRQADMAGEGDAERAVGAVADAARAPGGAARAPAPQPPRARPAPAPPAGHRGAP